MEIVKQGIKYGIVGVLNTLLTALVIWLMMRLLGNHRQDETALVISVSNIAGYTAGLINSFVWNRRWTFESDNGWKTDFLKFSIAFLICYIPQLLLVNALNHYVTIPSLEANLWHHHYLITPAYTWQLSGLVFYTVLNFLCNKYYTFRKK
jgi:putative flippase GtrA